LFSPDKISSGVSGSVSKEKSAKGRIPVTRNHAQRVALRAYINGLAFRVLSFPFVIQHANREPRKITASESIHLLALEGEPLTLRGTISLHFVIRLGK
jgi:hypothetical protein